MVNMTTMPSPADVVEQYSEAEDHLLCHLYKALNEVPSCGCGWPDEARQLVWDILGLMPSYGAEKKQRLADLIGPEASQQIVLSAIEGAGLISHGTSITSSWLEPRGRWVLWAVEQVGGIDGLHTKLEDVGFPHEWDSELKDMQPCTDACWVMPDGWEPTEPAEPPLKPEDAQRIADMAQQFGEVALSMLPLLQPTKSVSVLQQACYEASFGWVHVTASCRCR